MFMWWGIPCWTTTRSLLGISIRRGEYVSRIMTCCLCWNCWQLILSKKLEGILFSSNLLNWKEILFWLNGNSLPLEPVGHTLGRESTRFILWWKVSKISIIVLYLWVRTLLNWLVATFIVSYMEHLAMMRLISGLEFRLTRRFARKIQINFTNNYCRKPPDTKNVRRMMKEKMATFSMKGRISCLSLFPIHNIIKQTPTPHIWDLSLLSPSSSMSRAWSCEGATTTHPHTEPEMVRCCSSDPDPPKPPAQTTSTVFMWNCYGKRLLSNLLRKVSLCQADLVYCWSGIKNSRVRMRMISMGSMRYICPLTLSTSASTILILRDVLASQWNTKCKGRIKLSLITRCHRYWRAYAESSTLTPSCTLC